jgi:hypothetical protein
VVPSRAEGAAPRAAHEPIAKANASSDAFMACRPRRPS